MPHAEKILHPPLVPRIPYDNEVLLYKHWAPCLYKEKVCLLFFLNDYYLSRKLKYAHFSLLILADSIKGAEHEPLIISMGHTEACKCSLGVAAEFHNPTYKGSLVQGKLVNENC